MDPDFVGAILRSSGKFIETIKNNEELDELIEKVPAVDSRTVTALSNSLADAFSYKISPEAHLKYSVRLQLIEILREWINPPLGLSNHRTFCQSEKIQELCKTVINKYLLKKKVCDENVSADQLIILIRALINVRSINPVYGAYLKLVVDEITELEVSANYRLVKFILDNEKEIELEASVVDKFYICQSEKIIEEPIIDCFISNINCQGSYSTTDKFDKLINKTAFSQKIFIIVSNLLGNLFIRLEFSPLVLSFIEYILSKIIAIRDNEENNLLSLYPVDLQSYVVLLRIDPCHCSVNSKKYLLQCLKNIYTEDKDKVLVLITHFPKWLNELSLFLNEL
ncbi:uncharacterized protein LOC130677929 [Microplitis mediator]|uniref:uncharacterized protein LOC130677929 n=1 Tax=Microplitis mediator TaxID=375433 RepID=UPI002554B567|nr:uncharacterized protein LOC130677929 [Microplitis mediator]